MTQIIESQTMRAQARAINARTDKNAAPDDTAPLTSKVSDELLNGNEEVRLSKKQLLTLAYEEFFTEDAEYPLNFKFDVSLKQRIDADLSLYVREDPTVNLEFILTKTRRSLQTAPIDVNLKASRRPLNRAQLEAPYFYLTEDEARRIARRFMNRLNQLMFKHAARRKNNPRRLSAIICQHDKSTRRHLHCMIAMPPHLTNTECLTFFDTALRTEPFVYRRSYAAPIRDLQKAISYNIRDDKTINDNAMLYIHHQPQTPLTTTENAHDPERTDRPDRDCRFSLVAA